MFHGINIEFEQLKNKNVSDQNGLLRNDTVSLIEAIEL